MRRLRLLQLLPILPIACKGQLSQDDAPPTTRDYQSPAPPWGHLIPDATCPAPFLEEDTPSLAPSTSENNTIFNENETITTDGFVSFEEWKKVKFAENGQEPLEVVEDVSFDEGDAATEDDTTESVTPMVHGGRSHSQILSYNFASPDCSARIHSSSPQTQHASSLLHKSRDRYMLTPCKADQHWVTIELCDEIRVEAIEISMWEFFSGIVREVQLSGANDDDEFTFVANFTTKNARGSQTFFLPSATPFHRFLRLDFSSFYGSEYYCPVSQVKVFGMNQMDAFRWEQKQESPVVSEKKRVESDRSLQMPKLLVNLSADGSLERLLAQANLTNDNATSTSSTEAAIPSAPSGESIYALIVRRLTALEGNTTLIARYIEEQSGMMMNRVERKWLEWREKRDHEDVIERMRQEDRMGMILSQMEQQRVSSLVTQAQLARLSDELSYERRRGFAQLFVMLMGIILVVANRSNAVQRLLAPLTEVTLEKRQSSVRLPSRGGTLSDHRRRPQTPPTPTLGNLRRRHVSASFRSFTDHSSRPRSSMPPRSPRHLGRNAHLHPIGLNKRSTVSASPPRSVDEASEVAGSESDVDVDADLAALLANASPGNVPMDVKYA